MFFSKFVFFGENKSQKNHQPVAGYNCEELLGDILAQSFEGTFVPSAFNENGGCSNPILPFNGCWGRGLIYTNRRKTQKHHDNILGDGCFFFGREESIILSYSKSYRLFSKGLN